MGVYTAYVWVDGTSPVNSTNLSHIEAGLATAVQQSGNTSDDIIGYNLNSGTDTGIMAQATVAIVGSGVNTILKHNNLWNGVNDVYINGAFQAYQLSVSGAGVQCRKGTSSPSTGGVITWGSYDPLFT